VVVIVPLQKVSESWEKCGLRNGRKICGAPLTFDHLQYILRYILDRSEDLHMFGHFKERNEGQEHGDWRQRRGRGWWDDRGDRWGGHHGGFGGGRERFFEGGDLRLVILQLIAEKPSYGYEIIRAIEERLSGGYAPSPGVIYPTLTLLEEEGLAEVTSTEGNKKLYAATEEGRSNLKTNQALLQAIFGRMQEARKMFGRGRSPQIMRAMMNLQLAFKMRAERGDLTPEQVSKIAEAIDVAARTIDEV
jgi:DNA-binding PadR family transcriptional regulator